MEASTLKQFLRRTDFKLQLRTMGRLSSLCFVEIKKPTTELLGIEYRPDSWPPSGELAGAVVQVQTTVQSVMGEIPGKAGARGR
jgi:hypothetical protein